MGTASRSKAIRETQKIHLIDSTQHLCHGTLDYLILQSRHSQRPLAAVRFGDIGPPHRLRPVPSRMNPITEVFEVFFQVNFIVLRGNSIDSSTRFLFLAMERPPESIHIDMMQQRRELCLAPASRRLVHPGKIGWQGCPALRPDLRLPVRNPFRPGPSLRTPRTIFLRRHHQYYTPVRHPASARCQTPVVPCLIPPSVTSRRPRRGFLGSNDIRSSVMWPSTPAEWDHLALTMACMLPSTLRTVSASAIVYISWLNPTPHMTAVYASDPTLP